MNKNKNENKLLQFNTRSQVVPINAALIIFLFIFVYILITILRSAGKEPIATYKVGESNINNNITCTGIALRNEIQVTGNKSGYVCYYVRDGEKVKKGAGVCTIDETGNLLSSLSDESAGAAVFTDADYQDIRSAISLYKTTYTDENFYDVYNFKMDIDRKVLEISNEILMQKISESNATVQSGLQTVASPESGIVSYYTDGFETVTPETLTEDMFDKSLYEKNSLKSGEIINNTAPLFKIVGDENWHIVCQISFDEANVLLEESNVTFTINNSNYEVTAPFELIQKENGYFLNISLSKYMTDYISERYLNIEIILDKYEGLKIPNTALVEKDVYKIPEEYVSKGGNSSENNKVNIQTLDENNEPTITQVELNIYRIQDGFYYVDPNDFQPTDVIVQLDTNNTVSVSLLTTERLTGVYNANKGTADFTEVTILKTGDEFTIVSDDGKLREFDNIIMNSDEVKDNQIIY